LLLAAALSAHTAPTALSHCPQPRPILSLQTPSVFAIGRVDADGRHALPAELSRGTWGTAEIDAPAGQEHFALSHGPTSPESIDARKLSCLQGDDGSTDGSILIRIFKKASPKGSSVFRPRDLSACSFSTDCRVFAQATVFFAADRAPPISLPSL
jgi:hypothetical protein